MNILLTIWLAGAMTAGSAEGERTDTLPASVVTMSKLSAVVQRTSCPVVTLYGNVNLENRRIGKPNTLSSLVPNLHIPDYGSAMTSTIYARGVGSRMENPSIGLYVDDIPVLDKNMFDTDFLDVSRIDYVSGPQGTLFGRNAMAGLLSVTTKGTLESGEECRSSFVFGTGRTYETSLLLRNERFVVSERSFTTNGLYTNAYNGNKLDGGHGVSVRLKYQPLRNAGRTSDYSVWVSYLSQGGWPYGLVGEDGSVQPVSYNDGCHYRRLSMIAGAVESFKVGKSDAKNILSLQLLGDKMSLDQDFTPVSMFTLTQRQRQAAVTEELMFRPAAKPDWWSSRSGVFLFSKYNAMHAPVHFLQDGIESLIVGNANAHIPESIGYLDFLENDFIIGSDFDIFYQNAAVYHESWLTFGPWRFTAGLRADLEYQYMAYDSRTNIHFALLPRMTQYRSLETAYKGSSSNSWLQLVPKFAVRFGKDSDRYIFASASKGFRAGGFNTQIFSDILQNKMTSDLMDSMGVHVEGMGEVQGSEATAYKPETSWNFELGGRAAFSFSDHFVAMSASVFDIECTNQQITVFPLGKGTGRMMANAGRARSYGAELSASWLWRDWRAVFRAGYTHAAFVRYNDNRNDYAGSRVPYAPESTWHALIGRRFYVGTGLLKGVDVDLWASGVGRIWWNEDNSLSQGAYFLPGADVSFSFGSFDLFANCSNLTDKDYGLFCFKSVGNTFLQKGRPRRIMVGVRFNY